MDEIIRYEQLASAATTGHWPAHLLAPDEDRVYALGEALGQATEQIWHLEGEVDSKQALEEENQWYKDNLGIGRVIDKADRAQLIEIAVRNPEQVVESAEEIAERERLRELYMNSNMGLNKPFSDYEAGWKAAKAYYGIQDLSRETEG